MLVVAFVAADLQETPLLGRGKITFKDGAEFSGEWKDLRPSGFGTPFLHRHYQLRVGY